VVIDMPLHCSCGFFKKLPRSDQLAALRERLAGRVFDMLFVNAGVTNNENETIADVSTDEFNR
jgi:hypothetical protein